MKIFHVALLSFVGLAAASPYPASSTTQNTARDEITTSGLQKRASNPSVSGLKFNIDGTTAYFAGTNAYWIGFLASNTDVDTVMSHLKSSGLKVLRVWGISFLSPIKSCIDTLPRLQRRNVIYIRRLVPIFHQWPTTPDKHRLKWTPTPRLRGIKCRCARDKTDYQLCKQLEWLRRHAGIQHLLRNYEDHLVHRF